MPRQSIKIRVEGPSGEPFEAEVPCKTPLREVAADFAEAQGWPMHDEGGEGQRAVVEFVDPRNPGATKRLNSQTDICEAGLQDGDTLRIYPEAMAGAVDQRSRLAALSSDRNEMRELCARDPNITFTTNSTNPPFEYVITLNYLSFRELPADEAEPLRTQEHRVKITLGSEYPREAPQIRWLTKIFHPNIQQVDPLHPEVGVCIGELRERFMPGMGLARLVTMLAEMVQYRNFNPVHGINDRAVAWVRDSKNWPAILAIGGYPFQGPLEQVLRAETRRQRAPIQFVPVGPQEE